MRKLLNDQGEKLKGWGFTLIFRECLALLFALLLAACSSRLTPDMSQRLATQAIPEAVNTSPVASPTISGMIRKSVIAGTWYPDDPVRLRKLVESYLEPVKPMDGEPVGLVVPHAGYAYSGAVAAYGFKQMEGVPYEVAVIIASDHQLPLSKPISVWAEGGFETPLGVVPVNRELAQALVAADRRIRFDQAAHEGEHPIEIELPFLQQVCPSCSIVPILMGSDDIETEEVLSNALLTVLPGHRAVVIASSDLSHYPTYEDAIEVDGATLAAIETGEVERVRKTIAKMEYSGLSNLMTCACGAGPIRVVMRVAQGLGADTITVLRYANSGDVPQGDRKQVVGYGAVMFWRYQPPTLETRQRQVLLKLARETITQYIRSGNLLDYSNKDPELERRAGAFVTLMKGDELRGCIGHLQADTPLYRLVQQMAVSAAIEDPRFPPLTEDELGQIRIEISVLSPLRRITQLEQIQVGVHGLVLTQDHRQGVFLPQVPVEQDWDREAYLENLCYKAGLPGDCWTREPTLYTFTAIVFGE